MRMIRGYTSKTPRPSGWKVNPRFSFPKTSPSFHPSVQRFSSSPTDDRQNDRQVRSTVVPRGSSALHSMIAANGPPALIFQTIVNSANAKVSSELTETFLFMLLENDDLDAAVSLVHVLFHVDAKHYKLSNQFWSLLATKAGSLGHHAASSLVYHEIVNPFTGILTEYGASQESKHVPFLLLPTAIESLAIVFAQNGNHIAIEGLRQYFKRFYSYFGHRETYQTLLISQVESLAKATLLSQALQAFGTLALRYRGHHRYRNAKNISHSLKYISYSNFRERSKSISLNIPGAMKTGAHQNPSELFSPDIRFNMYRRKAGSFWAIFNDVLMVEDLPQFRGLLRETIEELFSNEESVVDRLTAFISKRHPSIFRIVLACLCDLEKVPEALAVANKIPQLAPTSKNTSFILPGDVLRLFTALESRIRIQQAEACAENHQMLLDSYHLCQRSRALVPRRCFQYFLRCYFASPLANMSEITLIVKSRKKEDDREIFIEQETYQKALSRGFKSSELKSIFDI